MGDLPKDEGSVGLYQSPVNLDISRLRRIIALAAPIMAGMTSQNVLNLVDTAFVGRLGEASLAAVGMGGFANWLTIAFLIGLGAGVQAITARRFGEGDSEHVATGLNSSLVIAFAAGIPVAIAGITLSPWMFSVLVDDPAVQAAGSSYLAARFIAVPFVAANFAFRGFWNGTNRPTLYMGTLVSMHVVNVVLDYGLIFGNLGLPELGAQGAGYATSISVIFGTGIYVVLGIRKARHQGFLQFRGMLDVMGPLLRLSLPACLQQFTFRAGFVVFFTIAGRIGTRELAASNVILNLLLVCILPGLGLGLAGASLVGQALGAGDKEDARRWGREVLGIGFVATGGLGLILALGAETWLGLFIPDSPETVALAIAPLTLVGLTQWIEPVVVINVLVGVGDTLAVLIISLVTQWLIFLPTAYAVAVVFDWGLLALWGAMVLYRALSLMATLVRFHQGAWADKTV